MAGKEHTSKEKARKRQQKKGVGAAARTLQALPGAAGSPAIIAQELEDLLHTLFVDARSRKHEFISVEHLLAGLLNESTAKKVLLACNANLEELKTRLAVFIDESTSIIVDPAKQDTLPTPEFQRVIQRAIIYVQTSGRKTVHGADCLVAIYGEKDSHAVYFLRQQGVTRFDVLNFLTHGTSKKRAAQDRYLGQKEDLFEPNLGQTLKNFAIDAARSYAPAKKPAAAQPKLFISYSHVDTRCLERLLVHLKPLERSNTVVCWSDTRIRTGDKWRTELQKNLEEAVIAILLISADFLASDFIVNNELPPLLIKADQNGLRILPVILKPCGFRRDPILSTFQAANDPSSPLLGMTSIEQEALYDKIAEEVMREIISRRS
jgi:hypothetical protein